LAEGREAFSEVSQGCRGEGRRGWERGEEQEEVAEEGGEEEEGCEGLERAEKALEAVCGRVFVSLLRLTGDIVLRRWRKKAWQDERPVALR
jgi:hypothetical protein